MLLEVALAGGVLSTLVLLIRERRKTHVAFGILGKTEDGGDYVALEASEIPFLLQDRLRFGLVFFKRRAVSFNAQVVHFLPAAPKTLAGSIAQVTGTITARGFRVEGPTLRYVQGGVRVLGLSEGDPPGPYELDLFINRKLVKTVRYKVLPPVEEGASDA